MIWSCNACSGDDWNVDISTIDEMFSGVSASDVRFVKTTPPEQSLATATVLAKTRSSCPFALGTTLTCSRPVDGDSTNSCSCLLLWSEVVISDAGRAHCRVADAALLAPSDSSAHLAT